MKVRGRNSGMHGSGSNARKYHSFQCRTLEIFDSFGIGQKVWQESNHMLGERYASSLLFIRRRGMHVS